jgi:hypothetical protein
MPVRQYPGQSGQAIIFRLPALFRSGPERQIMTNVESSMGHMLMRALYLLAIVVATAGWLWLLVWVVEKLV